MGLFDGMSGSLAGVTSGFSNAQGQYNQKMMDFINQKNQTMATMYSHLADQAQDQDVAQEFLNRAAGWATANPLLNPKGYKDLLKQEKDGLHGIVDRAHQNQVGQYHQQQFGIPATMDHAMATMRPGQGQSAQPSPTSTGTAQVGGAQVPITGPQAPTTPGTPPVAAPAAGGPPPAPAPTQAAPPPTAMPPGVGQPAGPPAGMTQPQMSMDQYVRGTLPPEPQQFGSLGRFTPEWQDWHQAYLKRMESVVPTPAGMQNFIGSPYMNANFASPFAMYMGRTSMAQANAFGKGGRLMPDGSVIPLAPEQLGLLQQSQLDKNKSQIQLNDLTGQYRQAVAKKDLAMIPVLLERISMQKANLYRMERETAAKLGDVDPATGRPFPGSFVLPDGTIVGTSFQTNVKPTAAEQGKAGAAVPVVQHGQSMIDFASNPVNADLFGKLQGNWANFIAGTFGTGDPREAGLRADIRSMASLLSPLHGFRSQKAAEEFITTLNQGNSPEAFANAVEKYMFMAQTIYEEGMPTVTGAGGKPIKRTSGGLGGGPPQGGIATQAQMEQAARDAGWNGLKGSRSNWNSSIQSRAEGLLKKQNLRVQ